MATMAQWMDSIDDLGEDGRREVEAALRVLQRWEMFETENPWMRLLHFLVEGKMAISHEPKKAE